MTIAGSTGDVVEVVSAVVIRNGRVLLTQRREHKDYPMTWECPGGKVEGNESHHDALRREIMEELDCDLRVIWCNYVTPKIFLLMYRADLSNTPRAREKQGIGWFTPEEMRALGLTPGNMQALASITHCLKIARSKVAQ